ncbi:MAG: tetratricopeptide repeat protein [Cyanobacteriota bacterium]|nr:tetratricopeptide repeat protein [Cyanobacteriota bacterium]
MARTNSIKIANELLQAGKLDDAQKEYQRLIELKPYFAWNYYYLGQLFFKQGKWQDAVTQYRQAIKLNPNSASLHNSLAEALIQQGELDEAINYSQKAVFLEPDLAIYHQNLALAYEAKLDFELAFKTWKKILSLNPDRLKAIQKISWLETDVARDCVESGNKLDREGKIKEAVEFYRQALILNPQQPMPIYRTCGNNLITLGRFEEAEKIFKQLIKVYPELPDGYDGYAAIANSLGHWELALKRWSEAIFKFPDNIDFKLKKGNTLVNLSRFDEAKTVFKQLKEKYPDRPHGYEAYARLIHRLGDGELALKLWSEAVMKFPKPIGFQVQKGNALINLSRFDEAEGVFQQLIEKYPDRPHGYERCAALTHSLGDWELALKRWSEAIAKFPDNIDFQVQKGNILINLSRFDEAEAVFQQLIEKYPDRPHGYERYAALTHSLGDWELALKRWSEAVVKFPKNIGFQVQKGNILINLSRFNEAEAVFQQLIEKYPDMPHGYERYAALTHSLGDWELALKRWSEAILKFPDNMGFQVHKGNALINLSRFNEAEAVFQQLIEEYPNQPRGYEGYARVAQSFADWELARERWENAISHLPDDINFRFQKGNVLIKLSRFDEAETVFQEIIEQYPQHYCGYDGYGRVADSLADWELALERWENAIAKLPQHFNFYLQKGDVLANLFRYEEAETWWEKVIALYPDRHEGLSKSAALARLLGNREFALQRFEQTIEKFPGHIPAYCEAAKESIAMGRFAEAEETFLQALQRNPNDLTLLLQGGILASQQGSRELALERFERAIEFYHPQKAIDAYILAATELKYLGRDLEAIAKYEQILSFHQQRGLYPEVKLLGTGLTSIQELGLLLDRLVIKQPDSVEDIVSLAKLTDRILFFWRSNYPAPVAKDAPSLLPKLKILKELFSQVIATQEGCQESFLLVLKHFNMAIQLLEEESQRLNSSDWRRVKLIRSEMPLPLTDKLCFEGLSSSARYVMGTDERVTKSQVQATVKYLPELMDRDKEYFEASVRKLSGSFKFKSRQTIEIFKDFICDPPFGVAEGYIFNRYDRRISEQFVKEFIGEKTTSSREEVASADNYSQMANTRATLEEIAIKKTALDNYYEDDVVFGLPVVSHIWGAYQNYAHLLLDQIPSLILYQKLNLSCPIFVPHITDSHWEIFSLMNVPKEKILVKQEQKFKYFILSHYQYDEDRIDFYRKLRESIVAKRSDIPSEYRARYVYISRRYSHRRPMVNEVEVEELMASFGFSIVYAERLSFEEKAMLMHHTSVLVGTIGAGLSSILMCHPNTTIVEIFPELYILDRYFYPVSVLGEHNFYPLYCDKTIDGFEISIDKLKRVITAILEGE